MIRTIECIVTTKDNCNMTYYFDVKCPISFDMIAEIAAREVESIMTGQEGWTFKWRLINLGR